MSASLLFENGPILTQDKRRPVASALAVVDDRVAALDADALAMLGPKTRVVDLAGRALLPGFIDAHNHFVSYGVRLMRLDLGRATSKDDLLQSVKERAGMTPADGWIVGHSWDEAKWRDKTLPTLVQLDAAAGGRKTLLARVDRHGGLATSAAQHAAGLTPTEGFVVEAEYGKLVQLTQPSLATMVKGIQAASRRALELGVTSSHVMCTGEDLAALQAARGSGALGVRASCFVYENESEHAIKMGARRGLGDAWVRVLGVKLFADGSFGSRSAAISGTFLDAAHESGMFVHETGLLEMLVKRIHEAGLQVAVHAIGDRAVRRTVDAFESAGVKPADRARIEHLEWADDADLRRAAAMGVIASVQPNFTGEWGHKGGMYEARLGWERARRLNRFARYQEEGLALAFGSDDMPLGPLYGIASAVHAPEPEQRVGVEDAIRAYTAGSAWAGFAENEVGTLAPGMLADLVVLSRDPRSGALSDSRVDLTAVGGRIVFERGGRQ